LKSSWNNPSKVLHKKSGAQPEQWEKLLHEFSTACGWSDWWTMAANKNLWKEHEIVFAAFVRVNMAL